jgi:hypothetical protein
MANNVNQQAINFANNYARTGADDVVSCYLTMARVLAVWNGQNIGTVIPNDSNLIQDGATTATPGVGDGRAPIADAQVQTMISNMTTLVGYFTANSNLLLNQFLQIQVNAQSVVS